MSNSRSVNPRQFLDAQEAQLVEQAIARAESRTSAEIKFIIARHCWGSIQDKARRTFARLGLHKTRDRNCVLILLVTANREFIIYGDRDIHEKAGQQHWDDVRDRMVAHFKEDCFGRGICEGIDLIGAKLQEHFPHRPDDVNEIPDEIGHEE